MNAIKIIVGFAYGASFVAFAPSRRNLRKRVIRKNLARKSYQKAVILTKIMIKILNKSTLY